SLFSYGTSQNARIQITNNGVLPQSNIPVSYQIMSGPGGMQAAVSEVYVPVINSGVMVQHQFTTPMNISVPGDYVIRFTVNQTGDTNVANNALEATFYSRVKSTTVPVVENFDGSVTPNLLAAANSGSYPAANMVGGPVSISNTTSSGNTYVAAQSTSGLAAFSAPNSFWGELNALEVGGVTTVADLSAFNPLTDSIEFSFWVIGDNMV